MRKTRNLAAVLLIASLVACSQNALKDQYRTIGVIVKTVDLAMQGWGAYVRAGKANSTQEDAVRKAYGAYQKAAQVAATAYKLSSDSASPTDLSLAAGALIGLIDAFSGTKTQLVSVP